MKLTFVLTLLYLIICNAQINENCNCEQKGQIENNSFCSCVCDEIAKNTILLNKGNNCKSIDVIF